MEDISGGEGEDLRDDGFISWDHQRRSSLIQAHHNTDHGMDEAKVDKDEGGGYAMTDEYDGIEDEEVEEEGENETWSVRVRLISAVDLPTSLTPSTPLCPLFKLGLVTLNSEEEVDKLIESQNSSTYDFGHMSAVGNNSVQPQSRPAEDKKPTIETFLRSNIPLTSLHSTYDETARIKRCGDKITSSRDNGMMEWHEDLRWNDVALPLQTVLAVELVATSVLPSTTSTMKTSESYSSQSSLSKTDDDDNESSIANREDNLSTSGSTTGSGILNLWRKGRQSLEQRRRIGNVQSKIPNPTSTPFSSTINNFDGNVETKHMKNHASSETDLRLGALVFPLSQLPLGDDQPKLEKWFQLDAVSSMSGSSNSTSAASTRLSPRRSPSVLLEITLSSADDLDDSEDDEAGSENEDEDPDITHNNVRGSFEKHEDTSTTPKRMPSRKRTLSSHKKVSINARTSDGESIELDQMKQGETDESERIRQNGPFLHTGIVDYIAVVGPKNIGNQKDDDGSRGWVKSSPTYGVLEQFPQNDDLHTKNGRHCSLPQGIEWWCFPEGCKIWRGTEAPTHLDMNLKRFTASSISALTSSVSAFDACLNCTTSFLWWVINSKSDEYGSQSVKTYGAVIRFYVPAPVGVDRTQDDYAQSTSTLTARNRGGEMTNDDAKRIWCPIAICLTSSLPIIGILEALLLRLCEKLALRVHSESIDLATSFIHSDILNLIANFQAPIPGVMNCSIPFLTGDGDRLLVSLPPVVGLPALPHGSAVTSVCRLLGPEGLTALLAAVLTECKVLIHSADVANMAMVAEVVTALIYPFVWQLPYIPVLPLGLFEIIEAPLAFILGIPTCNLQYIDRSVLSDIVVIDLDNGFSSPDYFDGRRSMRSTKAPTSLPASVSSNISKAVFRLLREEEEVEEHFGASNYSGIRHLPKLEGESLAEREFRIAVSQQICGLVRGYQDCLFFVSASQPVFNRDRFLRHAPALYEDRKGNLPAGHSQINFNAEGTRLESSQRILSPRSKRFLSAFVNTQLFHALLERLDSEEIAFFHEIMDTFELDGENKHGMYGSAQQERAMRDLNNALEIIEQKIPTYHIRRKNSKFDYDEDLILGCDDDEAITYDDSNDSFPSFTHDILQPVAVKTNLSQDGEQNGVKRVSLEKLVELDERPWNYDKLFDIEIDTKSHPHADKLDFKLWPQMQLRDALGERKFRDWKAEQQKKKGAIHSDESDVVDAEEIDNPESAIDIPAIISSASNSDCSADIDPRRNHLYQNSSGDQSFSIEMDAVRNCLVSAYQLSQNDSDNDLGQDQYDSVQAEARDAMSDTAAQRYFMSILNQPTRLKAQGKRRQGHEEEEGIRLRPRQNSEVASLRLQPHVFECFVTLCHSMLDACENDQDYETAYRLLTHTTGFCTILSSEKSKQKTDVLYMTKRISVHHIFDNLLLWDQVSNIHQRDRRRDRNAGSMPSVEYRMQHDGNDKANESDEYEAAVSTMYEMLGYGIPADTLIGFARICGKRFYSTEREDKILLLARRLVLKCDDVADSEKEMSLFCDSFTTSQQESSHSFDPVHDKESEKYWEELVWRHPYTQIIAKEDDTGSLETAVNNGIGQTNVPVTALASFGGSVIATGGLDGSVYINHTFNLQHQNAGGVRLEPNNIKNNTSGEIDADIGAVNCLVATKGLHLSQHGVTHHSSPSVEALLSATLDCHIIAGMTSGSIKVWSVNEVLASKYEMKSYPTAGSRDVNIQPQGVDLAGHRGGVTCLDVPSDLFRLDSLVSGGNDGLIKIWSLRDSVQNEVEPNASTRNGTTSRLLFTGRDSNTNAVVASPEKEPRDTLTGHGGRLTCLKSSWYGDNLVSAGEDRTLKLWDLSSSGGRCTQTLEGHTGWISKVEYWGRNTIISSSTDRSIGLWDMRAGESPLAFLRYHTSPISDIFIGSRSSFHLVSAGADGAVAIWDFRKLSEQIESNTPQKRQTCQTFRLPGVEMNHCRERSFGIVESGPVMLSRGSRMSFSSVMSVGVDGKMKEWDITNGKLIDEHTTKHHGAISCFSTFNECDNLSNCNSTHIDREDAKDLGGTITTSWDGSISMRRIRRVL